MEQVTRIGMDTSKRVFQVHGVDAGERPVLRRQLRRDAMVSFFAKHPPVVVAIEACGSAHHWARVLGAMGHAVRLIAPQLAKPYVKRGKNDAADAEALCEAASRPTMRFVPAKTADQQAALLLASERERLVRARTQLVNAIRGHAAEFGLVEAKGVNRAGALLGAVAADQGVPAMAREVFAGLAEELAGLELRLAAADQKLRAWRRDSEVSRRLLAIPGIGPVGASLLAMKVPDPHAFKSGRDFAAWLGLTPKDHSTAGKARPGGITRAGDEALRSVLVVGATAVIRQMRTPAPPKPGQTRQGQPGQGQAGTAPADAGQTGKQQTGKAHAGARPAPAGPRNWLARLLERKAPKLAAVALANKMARIAWKLMVAGGTYDPSHGQPGATAAPAAA